MEKSIWRTFTTGQKIGKTTNGVHIGALVKIEENASSWNGERVENWYKGRNWYVTELEGNKATLGRDETGKYKMAIPISTSFLIVLKQAEERDGE